MCNNCREVLNKKFTSELPAGSKHSPDGSIYFGSKGFVCRFVSIFAPFFFVFTSSPISHICGYGLSSVYISHQQSPVTFPIHSRKTLRTSTCSARLLTCMNYSTKSSPRVWWAAHDGNEDKRANELCLRVWKSPEDPMALWWSIWASTCLCRHFSSCAELWEDKPWTRHEYRKALHPPQRQSCGDYPWARGAARPAMPWDSEWPG